MFPLLNKTSRKYKNDTFPWKNKKGTRLHEREKCTALCAMSFEWFSLVLHCESRRFSSALWELSFIAKQWLFGISNQKTFWVFLVNVKRSLSEPEKLKRFFDERCQTELNSHSKLLNLLDEQWKTTENQSKLIKHRAVHFSHEWKRVHFLFVHGMDLFYIFAKLSEAVETRFWFDESSSEHFLNTLAIFFKKNIQC